MKIIKKIESESKLEGYVRRWLNQKGKDSGYEDGAEGALSDLMRGGCASGFVGELIYYGDTVKFFKKYKEEISELLKEALENVGGNIADIFGERWDETDPLALEVLNQNLLAWFGFEESSRIVAHRAGIEL